MKNALLCLLLLACFVIPASADSNPTINITPSPVIISPGATQLLSASFSDGSQIQSCTWMVTGSLNAIQSLGVNTSMFAAGTLKATYIATASCTNTNNNNAMGIAIIVVR